MLQYVLRLPTSGQNDLLIFRTSLDTIALIKAFRMMKRSVNEPVNSALCCSNGAPQGLYFIVY